MSMITVKSPSGKTIRTDSNPLIQKILEENGIPWFLALQKPVTLPEAAFKQIDDTLISK